MFARFFCGKSFEKNKRNPRKVKGNISLECSQKKPQENHLNNTCRIHEFIFVFQGPLQKQLRSFSTQFLKEFMLFYNDYSEKKSRIFLSSPIQPPEILLKVSS